MKVAHTIRVCLEHAVAAMDGVLATRWLDWRAAALRPITRDRIDTFDVCCPSPEPGTNWTGSSGSLNPTL